MTAGQADRIFLLFPSSGRRGRSVGRSPCNSPFVARGFMVRKCKTLLRLSNSCGRGGRRRRGRIGRAEKTAVLMSSLVGIRKGGEGKEVKGGWKRARCPKERDRTLAKHVRGASDPLQRKRAARRFGRRSDQKSLIVSVGRPSSNYERRFGPNNISRAGKDRRREAGQTSPHVLLKRANSGWPDFYVCFANWVACYYLCLNELYFLV